MAEKTRPPVQPELQAAQLGKQYDGFKALDAVSFSVARGEVFGLLGPNGAGKTTCMKIFTCLIQPTDGRAFVGGLDVTSDPLAAKRLIGYLPELPSLFEHLTGREMLELVAMFRGMEPSKTKARIDWFARAMDLGVQIDSLIGTYSKGMRQKVAFATATIHEPPIVILDEPTSGLDPRFGRYIKDDIRHFREEGRTVLVSTHITTVAEELCDRVAIISRGSIAAIGTVREILEGTGSPSLEDAFIKIVGGETWKESRSTP